MRTAICATLAFGVLVTPQLLFAEGVEAPSANEIVVYVLNLRSSKGQVGCSIYSKSDGFPLHSERADEGVWAKIDAGNAACVFKNMKPGTYAVALGHDEDGNGKVDRTAMGRPIEAWGVSNDVPPKRFSAPKYDKAKFAYAGGMKTISIKLRYPKKAK